ncbi:tyrosine-type recombinase/integrase [Streptomyces sp. NBC_00658]|uniref:tyrosine-type recombinase/integrase n=1 Tax=Streptomyces sp. NBC_00658 TaxID=2975800 RepID=UPI00324B0B51
MFKGSVYKRCTTCEGPLVDAKGRPVLNDDGTQKIGELGTKCPALKRRDHGSWYYYVELEPGPGGARRRPRKGGFATKKDAEEKAQEIWDLAQAGVDVLSDETMSQYLRRWLDGKQRIKRSTRHSYEDYLRLYFVPQLGHIKLRDLRTRHIEDMFTAIRTENETRLANQTAAVLARAAERTAHKTWRDAEKPRPPELREKWNEAKRELKKALAKPRRSTEAGTQTRIKVALSSALESARKQRTISDNWAAYVDLPSYRPPRPMVWTASRVTAWRKTGTKPNSVMVWRPEHTGQFLDSVVHDRLYPLWHLVAFHGLRRGESCALSWGEVDLDEGVIHITEQIVAVAYEPYEDTPKTDQIRDITLDQDTHDLLRWWKARQEAEHAEALEKNKPWEDNGRVFTIEDGAVYHPQFFSDRFERLYKKVDLPPIRLHDLRHGAATIALLAGVHIKVVQKKLGHSSIKVTGDIYTSVLEEVEREAAEATLAAVPRARKKILQEPEEDDSTTAEDTEDSEEEGTDGDEGAAAAAA